MATNEGSKKTMVDLENPDSLYEAIVRLWKGNNEMSLRVNAHIQAVTGGNFIDLATYHLAENVPGNAKVEVYQDIMRAILKTPPAYGELKGAVASGQGVSQVAPTAPVPMAPQGVSKPAPVTATAPAAAVTPAPKVNATPAASVAPRVMPVANDRQAAMELIAAGLDKLLQLTDAPAVTEARVREIVREELQARLKALVG